MRGTIRYTVICGSLILAVLSSGCKTGGQSITYAGEQVPAASAPQTEEEIIYLIGDDEVTEPEQSSGKRDSLINPEGTLLYTGRLYENSQGNGKLSGIFKAVCDETGSESCPSLRRK